MLITTWSLRDKLIIHVPALRTSRLETLSCLPLTSSGEQKKKSISTRNKSQRKVLSIHFSFTFFFLNKNWHQCIRFISANFSNVFNMGLEPFSVDDLFLQLRCPVNLN